MSPRKKAVETPSEEKPKRGRPKKVKTEETKTDAPKKGRPKKVLADKSEIEKPSVKPDVERVVYEKAILKNGPDGHFVPLDEFLEVCSYWEPPAIKVELYTAEIQYLNVKGEPFKTENCFASSKVTVSGEFDSIHVNIDGIERELEEAINKIIAGRTKISVNPRGTSMKVVVSPTVAINTAKM